MVPLGRGPVQRLCPRVGPRKSKGLEDLGWRRTGGAGGGTHVHTRLDAMQNSLYNHEFRDGRCAISSHGGPGKRRCRIAGSMLRSSGFSVPAMADGCSVRSSMPRRCDESLEGRTSPRALLSDAPCCCSSLVTPFVVCIVHSGPPSVHDGRVGCHDGAAKDVTRTTGPCQLLDPPLVPT